MRRKSEPSPAAATRRYTPSARTRRSARAVMPFPTQAVVQRLMFCCDRRCRQLCDPIQRRDIRSEITRAAMVASHHIQTFGLLTPIGKHADQILRRAISRSRLSGPQHLAPTRGVVSRRGGTVEWSCGTHFSDKPIGYSLSRRGCARPATSRPLRNMYSAPRNTSIKRIW